MDQDFEQELLQIFKAEAEDYLNILNDGLIALDEHPDDRTIEEMFRTTHSLKGAARAVNFSAVEELCQAIESLFAKLKNHELELTENILDVLIKAIDHLNELLNENNFEAICDSDILDALHSATAGKARSKPVAKSPSKKVVKAEERSAPAQPKSTEEKKSEETIRIPYQNLRELFAQSEDLINIKIKYKFYLEQIHSISNKLDLILKNRQESLKGRSVVSESRAFAQSMDRFKELDQLKKDVEILKKHLENDHFQTTAMIDNHLEDIKQLMMFPFSTITNYLERSTKTIAREMKKKIELRIYGKEIKIDKHTLELLKDPLIHLIRNSLDHGIEPPEERKMRGKPENGKIVIEVLPPKDQSITIKISDDGRGLDVDKIKQKAIEKKLVSEQELNNMDESQVVSLIFRSGFSTKSEVSKLSGRGLGMAVVLENIEKLGGSLKVENYFPNGSTFYLNIPLSFATSQGILIQVNDLRMIIPTKFVRQPVRIKAKKLKTVDKQFVLNLNGDNIPLFSLASLISLPESDHDADEFINILILKLDQEQQIAVSVDKILDEKEIILKKLNPPLEKVPFLSGVTILGDGALVPVLNVHDIFNACQTVEKSVSREEKKAKRILAVEDSITSRVLLKNILESAGFEVKTVVNGKQAWDVLKKETFDLIISDVEMPEMDGVTLTRKIKSNARLKSIPVLLLTSLGSEEDKKKGLEAGANAYFVKKDFKQKSLFDLINKLI